MSSTEQNHANFSENEFLPAKLRDTNIQASTVRATMMVSVVVIPEAVTEETDFLVPKMHCLNKLRDKSRTDIDCVGFCACESAVSR